MSEMPPSGIHRFFNHPGVRRFFRAIRVPLAAAAAVLLILYADPAWFLPAFGVSLAGSFIQSWCFGTLEKNKGLTANGPYALVRNPMYLGRYFLILGALMLTGSTWLLALFSVLYYLYMRNRVLREESVLREILGAEYEAYCAAVRRFLPSPRPYRGNPVLTFRRDLFLQNHGHWNLLSVVAFYVAVYIAIRWQ